MPNQDRSDWLTTDAAAARLGVSPATIKRRIQDGKPVKLAGDRSVALESEMLERPQGHEWRVRIIGALPPLNSDPERPDSEEPPPISSVQQQPQDFSAALSVALEPLREALASERTERQQLAQATQELAARAAAAEVLAAQFKAERDAERAKSWWDKLRGR